MKKTTCQKFAVRVSFINVNFPVASSASAKKIECGEGSSVTISSLQVGRDTMAKYMKLKITTLRTSWKKPYQKRNFTLVLGLNEHHLPTRKQKISVIRSRAENEKPQ